MASSKSPWFIIEFILGLFTTIAGLVKKAFGDEDEK